MFNKLYKNFVSNTNSITFLLLIIGTILLFLVLEPKISAFLFSWKRAWVLNTFLSRTHSTQTINPQGYWEFREFYSPGYFEVNKNGLEKNKSDNIKKQLPIVSLGYNIPVAIYRSPKLVSLDALTTATRSADVVKVPATAQIIFQEFNQEIYKSANKIVIVILLPVSQMKNADGFFDYTGDDKELLKDKYWLSISALQTD